jgi:rhamnogalacturonan endolyase
MPAAHRRPLLESLETRRLFAFGVTTGTAATGQPTYVVDNGGDLKFSVIRGGSISSTLHLADVSSIQYKGKELLAPYSTTSRYSHYEQGLGGSTTITTQTGGAVGSRWALVTCVDPGYVTQYYALRESDPNLYFASLPADAAGEGRFIAYLERGVFSNPELPSDNRSHGSGDVVSTIEGGDVFGHSDGVTDSIGNPVVQPTSSKFYNVGGRRQIEHVYHGLTGSATGTPVGAFMFMGSREHSAGGPFFRDIDFQSGSAVEIYNCIFTGHTQTEAFRQGLHVYAMQFTNGAQPVEPSYAWMEGLNLSGWIPAAQRGTVAGVASGIAAGHEITVGLSNATEQYWDVADAAGNYSIAGVHEGTYTQTLYDGELEVGKKTITVTGGGATTQSNIVNSFYVPANPLFRIGTWDGTPGGFLNADKIEIMHPSDVRMSSWTSTPNFVVGTNTDAQWPMAQFMDVNNGQRITFNLTAAQVQNVTLRIGVTLGFEGGRNRVTVNAGQSYVWTSVIPTASTDLNSRGITRGTWRGPNQLFTYSIPSSALRAGTNTIDLPVVSGTPGVGFLSSNVVYDAIDLVPSSSASTPAIASVTITPAGSSVAVNGAKAFTAVARDASNNIVAANFDWSATRGVIDANGNYIAPATPGGDTNSVTATRTRTSGYTTTGSSSGNSGSSTAVGSTLTGSGSTTVNVTSAQGPTVATPAAATPNPVAGTTTALSVLGADDGGEAPLVYTWAANGPAGVTFSANGTNSAKNATATFAAAGTYAITATITDANQLTAASSVNVVVNQTLTSIVVAPTSTTVAPSGTQQFSASAKDQFGANLTTQPAFTWSVVVGGGSIDANGLYTAAATAGSATVQAAAGAISGTAGVAIVVPRAWWKLDETGASSASDSSGNGNTGTVVGATWTAGKFGNALGFDGVDDQVTLPNSIANSAAGAVAMWVKTAANFADTAMLFYTSSATTGNGGGAENELHLNFLADERIQFFIEGGAADVTITSANGYADNAWHHVAATWDINGNAVLYVDGTAVGSATHDATNFIGSAVTRLGRPATATRYYNGLMDDVRLYNVAISPNHVAAIASEVPAGAITGRAFHDKNGDGAFNAGDVGLGGVTVFLDADNDGLLGGSETSTTTDGSGNYTFANVAAGMYSVREVAPSEFAVANSNMAVVSAGATSSGNDFANARIVYNGTAGGDGYVLRKNAGGKYEIVIGGAVAATVFAGAPSLTFNLGGGDDALTLDLSQGTPIPSGGVSVNGDAGSDDRVNVIGTAAAETIVFGDEAISIGDATVAYAGVEGVSFDGNDGFDDVSITGGVPVTLDGPLQLNSMMLSGAARVALPVGGVATVLTRQLVIGPQAQLDLADNDLIVDYPSTDPAPPGPQDLVAAGANGGSWDGLGGIVTSMPDAAGGLTTLGVGDAATVYGLDGAATMAWSGQTLDASCVVVKYTYGGDANLDGQITGDDYSAIDFNILVSGSSGFCNGDFNYDGLVTGDDYSTIDFNILAQGTPL